jgi:hypothetical protein
VKNTRTQVSKTPGIILCKDGTEAADRGVAEARGAGAEGGVTKRRAAPDNGMEIRPPYKIWR